MEIILPFDNRSVMKKLQPIFFLIFPVLIACNPVYKSEKLEFTNYRIRDSGQSHSQISNLIEAYSGNIQKTMNVVIGNNEISLKKNIKMNSLGYFLTDAYLSMAEKKFGKQVDVAFMNHGGIRLDELPAGEVKIGTIYELMPFDNILLLVNISGYKLRQYLDTLAAGGGVIQTGLTMTIRNRKTEEVRIREAEIENDKHYLIAISDYMVNSTGMLKNLVREDIGYLQRDAIIEYVKLCTQNGHKIIVENINRVNYAD